MSSRQSACGHVTKTDGSPCTKKCNKLLGCGHYCKGACDECFTGRVHVPCEQVCTKRLPCGHKCREKCCRHCPPCMMDVQHSCAHSDTLPKEICGNFFSECEEKCTWACEHIACNLLCKDVCKRLPCNKSCSKTIEKCGHPCIGLCSEKCPQFCRICNPLDDAFLPFLGSEDTPDAKFITLDCGHNFEVNDLDNYIENNDLTCPKCNQTILQTNRYSSQTKQAHRKMIEDKKIMWTKHQVCRVKNTESLRRTFEHIVAPSDNLTVEALLDSMQLSDTKRGKVLNGLLIHIYLVLAHVPEMDSDRYRSVEFAIEMSSMAKFTETEMEQARFSHELPYIAQEFDHLVLALTNRFMRPLDAAAMAQFRSEFYRILLLLEALTFETYEMKKLKLSGSIPLYKLKFLFTTASREGNKFQIGT